jgi:acylpyruvate hydrolase
MKIIAVGRNFAEHALEFQNNIPTEPVIFLKPDTALLRKNQPFYLPVFSNEIHHEVELVLKVCKEGKCINEKFAENYYDEIGLGIDFTARDLQRKLKKDGLPWELSKAFDNSSPIGDFMPKNSISDLKNINFHLNVNNMIVQKGNSSDLIFSFNRILTFVSRYITLKKGDLIYTGTPAGAGPVKIGDRLEGFIEKNKMFEFEIK